jgi:hypothetical protein
MMISTFLDEFTPTAKLNIDSESPSCFMSEESDANFNEAMQALIIRVQKNQDLSGTANAGSTFNKKSFEGLHSGKAIYKRNPESLSNIVNLANLSIEERIRIWPKKFYFVIENTKDLQLLIQAQTYLIKNENRQGARHRFYNNAELSSLLDGI